MTYDPAIARDVFRGLVYTLGSVAAGFGLAMLLIAILPARDEG